MSPPWCFAVLAIGLLLGCGSNDRTNGAGSAAGAGSGGGGTSGVGGSRDAGQGGSASAGDALCGKRPGGKLQGTHVLRFETSTEEAPALVLQLERAYVDAGAGESSIYELKGLHLAVDGETTCIFAPEDLAYENTHHNWFDVARGHSGPTTFELRTEFVAETDRAMRFEVVGLDAAGSPMFGPVEVIGTGSPPFCTGCWDRLTVAISEIMLDNRSAHADEAGDYEPWIEIYNYGSEDVSLAGWSLSDDFTDRRKWTFPALTIPRHEALVIFADGEPEEGELHAGFALTPASNHLILTDSRGRTDGGIVIEPQSADASLSFSWASGSYEPSSPSPGAPPP